MPELASKMWIGWKQWPPAWLLNSASSPMAVQHVVDVEHDRRRRLAVAAAEQIDEADADPIQRPRVGEVLQARDGRLARDVVTGLRRTLAGDQQRGVLAQRVEVIGILVAGGDRHHARGHLIEVETRR